jgi:hypothetical protein
MDLHGFWYGVITSSSNLTRLRNEATALRNRQDFQRSQLTELVSTDFESWAKESFEIAKSFAYRNSGLIRIPRDGNKDCARFCGITLSSSTGSGWSTKIVGFNTQAIRRER